MFAIGFVLFLLATMIMYFDPHDYWLKLALLIAWLAGGALMLISAIHLMWTHLP